MSAKVRRGDTVVPRELPTIAGPHVPLPDPGRVVHLQFRRYASCPICNLHLREFGRRHSEIGAAGIREIADGGRPWASAQATAGTSVCRRISWWLRTAMSG